MSKTHSKFEVEISNIVVGSFYYSFEYKITRIDTASTEKESGFESKVFEGEYESDHSWQDNKEGFLDLLEGGHAADLALDEVISH